MLLSRREFAGLCAVAMQPPQPKLRIGVMDGILRLATNPDSVAKAAALGAAGLQVTLGRDASQSSLLLSDAALQARFVAASKQLDLPLVSTYIDILHAQCLKSDRSALKSVADGIDITRRLNARILMLVFFGKCALSGAADLDAVVGPLRELAPEAAKARITLGFENTISAADNLRILDQVGSDALKIYYDAGNATNIGGFDPAREIRQLGKDRICQFHIKDKGYLGEGKVDIAAVMRAIRDIGFEGYAMLETSSPSGNIDNDVKRNLLYARNAFEQP